MGAHPSPRLERIAGVFLPAAVREEVLGDLFERYQSPPRYLASTLRLLPAIFFSRVRRTADPQLTSIVACLVYLSYLTAAWLASSATDIFRPALPAALTILGILLTDAYTLRPGPVRAPLAGAVLALPVGGMIAGALSLTLASATRMVLLPHSGAPPRQTAGGGRSTPASVGTPVDLSLVRMLVAIALILAWALLRRRFLS